MVGEWTSTLESLNFMPKAVRHKRGMTEKVPTLKIILAQALQFAQNHELRETIHNTTMVTKSKLKMALVAEKGVDFKKLNQKKKQKAARKEKASEGKPKKVETEWEDIEEESEGEDGGAAVNGVEDESGSEEEVDAPMQVNISSLFSFSAN
jgi:hypothetical protein